MMAMNKIDKKLIANQPYLPTMAARGAQAKTTMDGFLHLRRRLGTAIFPPSFPHLKLESFLPC